MQAVPLLAYACAHDSGSAQVRGKRRDRGGGDARGVLGIGQRHGRDDIANRAFRTEIDGAIADT